MSQTLCASDLHFTALIGILRNKDLAVTISSSALQPPRLNGRTAGSGGTRVAEGQDERSSDDSDSSSHYLSFDESDEDDDVHDRAARERERRLVLEAAGLIVHKDVGAPVRPKVKSIKRRPASTTTRPNARRLVSKDKDLPPVPVTADTETEAEGDQMPEPELTHEARLDDAFARYEAFKNKQVDTNRLSVVSTESSVGGAPSPTPSAASISVFPATQGQNQSVRAEAEGGKYSNFLNFLSRSKTPDIEHREVRRKSTAGLVISSPIVIPSSSHQQQQGTRTGKDGSTEPDSQSFGMSWASLVDKTALDGIPPGERKRQEAIFELINTEVAYVRDLQLIVEVFYSSMLPLLSTKEITVVFANIEDVLLTNTGFVSSLEGHQKDCRLYIDEIGDILLTHIPNMGVYMEYCVNHSTAIKVLQSLRESKPELALHLQRLRDENPSLRSLDLASYLLAPMQRITRYPLLIKQILQYTYLGEEHDAISAARDMAERLLDHINETIREQENQDTLGRISQNLWIGQGRLDLTAPTRNMGTRRLLKQGLVTKAKSGRKLNAFLCSDILVLTDEGVQTLYRMPIALAYTQVKSSSAETGFQISQEDNKSLSLRASTARDCQHWIQEINQACKKARYAEERAARKARGAKNGGR